MTGEPGPVGTRPPSVTGQALADAALAFRRTRSASGKSPCRRRILAALVSLSGRVLGLRGRSRDSTAAGSAP
jgi:hypothetical protein